MRKTKRSVKKVEKIKPAELPELKQLRDERMRLDARKRPTLSELARLAALLAQGSPALDSAAGGDILLQLGGQVSPGTERAMLEANVTQFSEMALSLWKASKDVLEDEILKERKRLTVDRMPSKEGSGFLEGISALMAARKAGFPLPCEDALRIIVGDKVRKPDRHKAFLAYLKSRDENTDPVSDHGFAAFRLFGISSEQEFDSLFRGFFHWRVAQRSERGKDAAEKRWNLRKSP